MAHLTALASEVSTGNRMLDRLLTGPGFLDSESHPTINLRSQSLVWVPTGWRSLGKLRVKGIEHPIASEFEADVHPTQSHAAIATLTVRTRWVLDSTWITTNRLPTVRRRILLECVVVLDRS